MTMPTPRLVMFTLGGTVAYLGLAILGWGGFTAFFSHASLIALAIVLFVLSGVALFSEGNLSPGEREDRSNRWVLAPFGLIGLLLAYVSAYTDRIEFWTIDGETVRWLGVVLFAAGARCASGRCSYSAVASADWSRSSPAIRWSRAASMASSVTPAISASWSARSGGHSRFDRASACCSQRCSFRPCLRASVAAALAVRRRVRRLPQPHIAAHSRHLLAEACNEFGQILASRAAKCRIHPARRGHDLPRY